MKYVFIRAHQAEFGVRAMCRVLRVHFSGFYAWLKEPLSRRAQEDVRQTELIRQAWSDSGKVYGHRKLADDLRDQGEQVSENRVARLASLAGILAQVGYNRRPGGYGGKPAVVGSAPAAAAAVNPFAKPAAAAPAPAAAPSRGLLNSPPVQAPAASKAPVGGRGQGQLRLPSGTQQCVIKALSIKEALLVVKRTDTLPQILDSAVLDLEQGDNAETARLNGYLHAIVAHEPKPDSEWLQLTFRFVDQDAQKLDYISRLIARGTAQKHFIPGA